MSIDVVGDFLTVIRNALMVYKRSVSVPYSNLKIGIAKVLKDEGYIKDFRKEEDEKGKSTLVLILKYVDGQSAINEITRVSKPGRRFYERSSKITPVVGGLGVAILTTSSGIMTDQQARKLSVGGEVICHVW
ncbi:30S ribosomal protein S8 [Candidatus Dependentiae bacterium]|nr:30S ribosomal protein S8 [Candidatus Dependentiae bacterium]MBU4387593.1 30S ribosomal protein S8 [Candidatus Dependentiae bacterium]MCG2756285.1 30S ribosomal protein S8 [Candidatus Dependentiae bacterium]